MGRAWMALSHAGVREIWLSATTKLGSFASGTRAFWITSFALSWFSSVSKRARTEVPSTATRSAVRLAAARACSTRCATASSILTPLLTAETCTAGVSPKKLGRLYKAPTSSTITRIAHFQTGYRFMIALLPHGKLAGRAARRPLPLTRAGDDHRHHAPTSDSLLRRTLGQHLHHGAALDLHFHVVGDLDVQETFG